MTTQEKKIDFSVIIPVLNEANFIVSCLRTIYEACIETKLTFEIFVLDGGSSDNTKKYIIDFVEFIDSQMNILIIENPKKIVSSALNKGIERSRGEIIFRCDAHCTYEKNYFKVLIESHQNHPDRLLNIGSLMNTKSMSENIETRLVKEVLKMPIAIGNSFRSLSLDKEKLVETVPFGSWTKDSLKKIGLFDENFIRGQDMEHNSRLSRLGGKCLIVPFKSITYFSRQDIPQLLKMMYQYGFWKVQVMKKNHVFYTRPLTLFFAMTFICLSIISSIAFQEILLLTAVCIYIGVIGLVVFNKKNIPTNFVAKSIKLIVQIHLMYFYGMLRSIFTNIKKDRLSKSDIELTR